MRHVARKRMCWPWLETNGCFEHAHNAQIFICVSSSFVVICFMILRWLAHNHIMSPNMSNLCRYCCERSSCREIYPFELNQVVADYRHWIMRPWRWSQRRTTSKYLVSLPNISNESQNSIAPHRESAQVEEVGTTHCQKPTSNNDWWPVCPCFPDTATYQYLIQWRHVCSIWRP